MPSFGKYISQLLDTTGDGTGTTNARGSYSVETPGVFKIAPGAGEEMLIVRMIVGIEDTAGFNASEYGNLNSALTNGMIVRSVSDSKGTQNFTPNAVTTNAEWGYYCYDVARKAWGGGNDFLVVRWTFTKGGVDGIFLDGDDNASLQVVGQDNLSGLINHQFLVQGHYLTVAQ